MHTAEDLINEAVRAARFPFGDQTALQSYKTPSLPSAEDLTLSSVPFQPSPLPAEDLINEAVHAAFLHL